ncbi:site-specific DNA-methyltransferase [candidate division KSB1 bacterium]|nr:site-specific DNA-methyltransferase [candidate division KSB1 bacterium]
MSTHFRKDKKFNGFDLKLATEMGALYRSDCKALLAGIKNNSVDCIFADPPFNLGKSYGSRIIIDKMSDMEYLEWTQLWISQCVRILKPGGSLFIYHIPKWLISISNYLSSFENMEFRHWIAIKMKNGFPIKNRLHPVHYGLLYYVKCGKKFKFHVIRYPSPVCRHCGELIRDYGGYLKKYRTNENSIPLIQIADVWDDVNPNIHNKNRPKSINELPSTIPERVIRMATNKGDIVLDPFAGGGSTLSMAESNERYWIGCELGATVYAQNRILKEAKATKSAIPPQRIQKIFR